MAVDPAGVLLSIGEFAQRTRLTHKALRLYDRTGLLRPATTDANGYRRYRVDQVRAGQLIGLLRGADIGLADISLVLADLPTAGEHAVERLERVLADLERAHTNRRLLIRHVQSTLREKDGSMFPIETRHVPARRVMSIQRRLRAPETDGFVRAAKAAFTQHLAGAAATGPFTLIFHGIVDADSDGPIEAVLGCPDHVQPTDAIGIRTEPAHDEAYTTITKAQWAYPAILAAYDAVACCPQAVARAGSRLSCREVYVAEPDDIKEEELVCDIAFPLGD
ncbi:MerR family transcriptional regulator [Streptomyces odontomachi]|uniref:MerR family transcriptional regulator n=1 Tax=Streptomyces odontomachi TaxID=2944940 RepID=UPI002109BCFE|nr:MerR family transcriptional regulator [Streptomyces sp. ODS25]